MRLHLKVSEGPDAGREVVVEAGDSCIVGRASECGLFLGGDEELSRMHFSIIPDAGGFAVKDLNSANGTELGGEEITQAPLKDGDRISAGLTGFTVYIEGIQSTQSLRFDQTAEFERPDLRSAAPRKKKDEDVHPSIRAIILVVISGPHKGEQHVIDRGHSAVVGRGAEANIHLEEDDELSKVHFSVAFKKDRVKLKDLGSVNGTLVNGTRVEKTLLHNGDMIVAGGSKIHMQYQRNRLDEDFAEDDAAASGDFRHLHETHTIEYPADEEEDA